MENTDRLPPRPYHRRTVEEWVELKRLYHAGASARDLAERFGGCERGIYTRLSKEGVLRRDVLAPASPTSDADAFQAAQDLRFGDEAAPLRALDVDATPTDAVSAAMRSAVLHLRICQVTGALNLMRLASLFLRVNRALPDEGADLRSPGAEIALDFLKKQILGDPDHG